MSPAPPLNERLIEKMKEQIGFIARSAQLFDEGNEDEAIRLAGSLRVMFHTKGQTRSLVSHLRLDDSRMLSSARGHGNWKDYLAQRIDLKSPHPITMKPMLGDQFMEMALAEWWSQQPVFVHEKQSYTRRLIVLSAAERDGAAHVDRKLDRFYEVLCGGQYAFGITGDLRFDAAPPFPQGVAIYPSNAHLALIRQFAHETLVSARHYGWGLTR